MNHSAVTFHDVARVMSSQRNLRTKRPQETGKKVREREGEKEEGDGRKRGV